MSGSKSDFHNGSLARLILTKSISTPAKVPSLSINYTNAKVRVTSSLTVTGKRETFCSSSLESIMNITDCTKDILAEIIRRLPMKEILVLGSVNRQWHEVTENFLSSSSLYLSYRLILNCEYPASVGVDGTSSELNESIKISRLNEFSNSPLVGRISRLAIYYPIVLPESSLGAMPFPLILLASRMPNVKIIEFFGNDPNVFYTHIGRPTLKYLFPQINQVLVSCDLAEFRLKLESNENNDFLPLVKLVVKVNYDTAIVAAFAKIDTFLEALRAEELINRNLFNNSLAMRSFSNMLPFTYLSFKSATELDGSTVLSTVTELRLVVSEHQNIIQTLTHLPQLKVLELDDERRCSCIVRLPLLPELASLTLAIHSCALDRNLLANVPKLQQLHIYSEGCGAVWLELLALNIRNLPGLTTLILNCWDDGKICCPDDIDDVLPDITERAERLKLLTLGPGVQPSINGLRLILNRSTVRVVNSYLCRTLHHPTVARELIELIRNSSVEILRTKVAQTTTQLIAAIEEILAKNHSKPNTTYILRESVNVLSVKSTVLANLTLFRLRKVNLVEPINRLRELRPIIPKGMGTEKALCGISSLCGPNSSSLTYEDCVHHSKGLESQPANSSSNRASVLQDRIQLRVANSMNGVENIKFTEVHNVTWVHWDDTDLAQHFQSLDEALQNDLKRTRTHWIQFLCIDENDIRH